MITFYIISSDYLNVNTNRKYYELNFRVHIADRHMMSNLYKQFTLDTKKSELLRSLHLLLTMALHLYRFIIN